MKKRNPLLIVLCAALLVLGGYLLLDRVWKGNDMETFDIEMFNRNKDGRNWFQTLPDGTKIRQWGSSEDGYNQQIVPPKSAYIFASAFDTEGRLLSEWKYFYSFPVGISKHYNNKGKLIREENHDKNFPFTEDNLAKMMLAQFDTDIMNSDNVHSASRGVMLISSERVPIYSIYCIIKEMPAGLSAYLVRGDTGEVLHTAITGLTNESKTVVQSYREKLEEQDKTGGN